LLSLLPHNVAAAAAGAALESSEACNVLLFTSPSA